MYQLGNEKSVLLHIDDEEFWIDLVMANPSTETRYLPIYDEEIDDFEHFLDERSEWKNFSFETEYDVCYQCLACPEREYDGRALCHSIEKERSQHQEDGKADVVRAICHEGCVDDLLDILDERFDYADEMMSEIV